MKEPTSAYVISHNDVTNSNFKTYFPEIIKKLNNASHIAVDLEFTALGDLRSRDMNHRYVAMKRIAESASVASFGLSIFHKNTTPKPSILKTTVSESTIASQPIPENSTLKESVSFSIVAESQPVLPKSNSILTKEEEEGLISSFLESDEDDEFSLPVASQPKTAVMNDDFSVTASTTITTTATAATTTTAAITTTTEKKLPEPPITEHYECDNFNFVTLKQGSIRIETTTGQFLVDHGYSFDRLFAEGIPFSPFSSTVESTFNDPKYSTTKRDNSLFNLWKHLLGVLRFHKIPLILHNGFYDLVYIYHSFIGALPQTFRGFLQLVSDSFPCGLYDTRYLALQAGMDATFLAYVFGASDRLRQNRFGRRDTKGKPYFEVNVKAPIFTNDSKQQGQKRKRESQQKKVGGKRQLSYCKSYSVSKLCVHI